MDFVNFQSQFSHMITRSKCFFNIVLKCGDDEKMNNISKKMRKKRIVCLIDLFKKYKIWINPIRICEMVWNKFMIDIANIYAIIFVKN